MWPLIANGDKRAVVGFVLPDGNPVAAGRVEIIRVPLVHHLNIFSYYPQIPCDIAVLGLLGIRFAQLHFQTVGPSSSHVPVKMKK